jgi:hypothetical protein
MYTKCVHCGVHLSSIRGKNVGSCRDWFYTWEETASFMGTDEYELLRKQIVLWCDLRSSMLSKPYIWP